MSVVRILDADHASPMSDSAEKLRHMCHWNYIMCLCIDGQHQSCKQDNHSKMFKIIALVAAFIAFSAAKPLVAPLVAPAPLVAAPASVVTASSSQYFHQNHNGLAAAYVAAPAAYAAPYVAAPAASYVAAPAAPYVAAPAAYAAPYVAAASPYVAAAAPYVAAPAPIVAV